MAEPSPVRGAPSPPQNAFASLTDQDQHCASSISFGSSFRSSIASPSPPALARRGSRTPAPSNSRSRPRDPARLPRSRSRERDFPSRPRPDGLGSGAVSRMRSPDADSSSARHPCVGPSSAGKARYDRRECPVSAVLRRRRHAGPPRKHQGKRRRDSRHFRLAT
jgi:hypothetical protein